MGTSVLDSLVSLDVDNTIAPFTVVRVDATINLRDVPDNVQSLTRTNLRRGYTTALNGQAAMLYHLLAGAFKFPVFSMGRTDKCVLSFEAGTSMTRMDEVADQVFVMWKLCNPHFDSSQYRWRFTRHLRDSAAPGWYELVLTRPSTLTIQSLLTIMELKSIWDVVPKEACQQALVAIENHRSLAMELRRGT